MSIRHYWKKLHHRISRCPKSPRRKKSRVRIELESLESRELLAVSFTAGPYAVPINTPDQPQGRFNGEPFPLQAQIAVNPFQPTNVILSTQQTVLPSTDAGNTYGIGWGTPFENSNGSPVTPIGHNSLAFGFDGVVDNVYQGFSAGGEISVMRYSPEQVGNNTWSGPITFGLPGPSDKESVAADSNGNVFVSWTHTDGSGNTSILLARSSDHGNPNTWQQPITVSGPASSEGFVSLSSLAVASDNTVFVAYHSEPGNTPSGTNTGGGQVFVVHYSNDLSTVISKTIAFAPGLAARRSSYSGMLFNTAAAGWPKVLADPLRPGNVYVVSINDPSQGGAGDPADVVFARSTDGGMTWTTSTVESGPNNSAQLFPTAAIDQFGTLAVAWYDNRAGALNGSGNFKLDVYAKYSADGGLTWSASFKVNDPTNSFDPQTASPDPTQINDGLGLSLFGGTAYVAWTGNQFDSQGNVTGQQIWTDTFAIAGTLTVSTEGSAANTVDLLPLASQDVLVEVNGFPEYAGLLSAVGGSVSINAAIPGVPVTVTMHSSIDTVNVESVAAGASVTIDAGTGNTTVNISPTSRVLDNIQGDVTVNNNNGGTATLNVDDQDYQYNAMYTLDGGSLTRHDLSDPTSGSTAAIHYQGVNFINLNGDNARCQYNIQDTEGAGMTTVTTGKFVDQVNVSNTTGALTVNGNGALDTFNVEAIAASGPLTVNLGSGADAVNLSPSAKVLDNFRGNVTVNGGTGTDTLHIMDSSSSPPGGRFYNLENDTLQIPSLPGVNISYANIANVELDACTQSNQSNPLSGNQVTMRGPVATQSVTIQGGGFTDVLVVDFSAGSPIPGGGVSFDGGAGTNFLMLQGDPYLSLTDTASGAAAGSLTFGTGLFSLFPPTITYANVQSISDQAVAPSGPFALANSLSFNAPTEPSTLTVGDGQLLSYGMTVISGTSLLTGTPTCATLAFTNRNYATVNSADPTNTIVVNTSHAAAALAGLTINAGPGNSLGNYRSTQNTYVLGTPAGVATTIDATNGWHDISVGLPTDPRINTTGLPGTPLDNIQGPLTISGQGARDVVNLWDWDSSTAQKTYAINSTNIAVAAVNGVPVANPVLISWQGILSVVALWGSAAADSYQFQSLPTNLAAIVVNGYYRANTFQSLLSERRTWDISSNTAVGSYIPGECAIDLGEVYNFTGGPSGDDFQFARSWGSDGALSGVLNGNGGTLDYSQDASVVTVNLGNDSATNLNGGAAGGFANIQSVIGNNTSTRLVGPNQLDYWNITGSNQGNLLATQPYRPGPFTFSQVPNLTGGTVNDAFQFAAGASVSGVIDGGGGTNTLDYSQYSTGVTVDLSGQNTPTNPTDSFGGLGAATGTAHVRHIQNVVGSRSNDTLIGDDEANVFMPNGGLDMVRGNGGDDTVRIWGPQDPRTSIDGGTGTNTLWAADFPNTWNVTRQNTGNVRGTIAGFVSGASFSHMQNLLGGLSTDTFRFAAAAGVDGWVNGNQGVNTLDYSAYTTPVTVNLSQFGSWGRAMNAPQGVMNFQIVLGSRTAGNTLTGSNLFATVLVGGAANDVLTAGTARAILIGGRGADVLQGGPADDLLIGGYTSFDTNVAALMQILAEWGSADSFTDRVNYLSGAVVNHTHYRGPALRRTGTNPTVFDDGSTDNVTGGGGMDWIIPS
jgi:hypothetical protein